jgi:guanine deaminase
MPAGPDPTFMQRAAGLALRAVHEGTGGPFGAVVVHAGVVVGEGQNRVLESQDPTAHAEVLAIRAASRTLRRYDLGDCELYASCEPCPMCLSAALWARIGRVWYAASRADAAAAGFDDARFHDALAAEIRGAGDRPLLRRFLPEAAREALDAWQAKPDRRLY